MILTNEERQQLYDLKEGKINVINFIFAGMTFKVSREEDTNN